MLPKMSAHQASADAMKASGELPELKWYRTPINVHFEDGKSPAGVFAELASKSLAWSDVHVILSDERWVPADHGDSNEKLVRDTLMSAKAQGATLLPVHKAGVTIEQRCAELNDELRLAPFPFACALLGMGEDGHFASLFPDAENLDEGLDVDSSELYDPGTETWRSAREVSSRATPPSSAGEPPGGSPASVGSSPSTTRP